MVRPRLTRDTERQQVAARLEALRARTAARDSRPRKPCPQRDEVDRRIQALRARVLGRRQEDG